jgi:transcriptional regulator with GAF, ATPase, and Fis domain
MLTAMDVIDDLEGVVRGVDDIGTALRAVARLRYLAEQLEREQVAIARQKGWSWQDIARCLGVTKQTVHRKYRRLDTRSDDGVSG